MNCAARPSSSPGRRPEDTLLEGWLSRGDRRMAEVIYTAWKNGTKFDAWQDQRQLAAWDSASSPRRPRPGLLHPPPAPLQTRSSPGTTSRMRCARNILFQDYQRSLEGETRADCREDCVACGILPTFAATRREYPGITGNARKLANLQNASNAKINRLCSPD